MESNGWQSIVYWNKYLNILETPAGLQMLSHNGGNRTKCVRHVVLPGIEENVRGVPKENLWLSQKNSQTII